ncbi:MAG: flagellar export protein FliJ [Proteobacteria bacterium]|nr:flagellar export protein FliJ [Pseudomonadota bacterium]
MPTQSSLSTLIELATREADQASTRLGIAIQAAEEAGRKLALLEDYRENYRLDWRRCTGNGLSIWKYRNFLVFLENIECAIASQKEVVHKALEYVAIEREAWQVIERKRLSYKILEDQAAQRELHMENKREQKLTDEHAKRQYQHRHKH